MTPTTLTPEMERGLAQARAVRRARVVQAHRILHAYANPLRAGWPLSSTEQHAVREAARLLRMGSIG